MKLHIAQVAPLYESVPPRLYGGTERIVAYLTDALIAKGHRVTLFASGDSRTRATLVSHLEEAIRLNPAVKDPMAHHIIQMADVMARAHEFDIIHFHTDYLHFPLSELLHKPHVTTLHGRLDLPDLPYVYRRFPHQPVISISYAQRKPLPFAHWVGNVYHGLPRDLYRLGKGDGGYVAFIGRISPKSGPIWLLKLLLRPDIPFILLLKLIRLMKPILKHPSSICSTCLMCTISVKLAMQRKMSFWAKQKHCCFPLTGPSRLAL